MSAPKSQPLTFNFVFQHPAHWLALGFGSGLSPVAPGTFGTLTALPFWLLASELALAWQAGLLLCMFLLGIWVCGIAGRNLGVHDHGAIVWDEFVGVWLTLMFAPLSLTNLLAGFIFFRFFDIAKPFPIRWLDKKVRGGLGVMLDDIVAGLFAGLCLYFFHRYMAGI